MSGQSTASPSTSERDVMHKLYRQGGGEKKMAPHVVYENAACPHQKCDQHMQGIDFRLEDFGRDVHDALVAAWWNDDGFAGQCPKCQGWIHFTIRGKKAIGADEAEQLPKLPGDWFDKALVL